MSEPRIVMVTDEELRDRLRKLRRQLMLVQELPSEEQIRESIRETEWLLNDEAP